MDNLHWGSLSSCVQPLQPRVWSHRQPGNTEHPRGITAADCNMVNGNLHVVDNLFKSGHEIQGIKLSSDSVKENEMIQLSPALDSINFAENMNLLQRQQQATRLASNTTWGEAPTADLQSPLISRLYCNTPLSSLMPDMVSEKFRVANVMEAHDTGVSADSLESLDCLLSASNSNTDASEDDGISMLFSDCSKLWNFNSSSAVSSGESENNEACQRGNPNPSFNHVESTNTRPSSSKRKEIAASQNHHYFDVFKSDSSTTEGGFQLISHENSSSSKKPRLEKHSNNINFQQPNSSMSSSIDEPDTEAIAQVKEMIYRAAVFRPVNLDLEVVEKPKRKNVRISSDPQTVAARQRRERISERIRILQRLVPGGNKMDTASMLDEAANYLKFLRSQIKAFETLGHANKLASTSTNLPFPLPFNQNFTMQMQPFFPFPKP